MRQLFRAACIATLPLMMLPPATAAEFTAKDLAAEEGKFAAYSVKNGMRAAFLAFFAEKSWLLRPEPVDAQAFLKARPDPAIILDWKSQRTILSASGDYGMSTGPWLLRSKNDPKAPAAHGQFFSVWQKQKNGEWKVFIDHGISHGPTATPDALPTAPLIARDLPAPKGANPVDDPEKDFITRNDKGSTAAAYQDRIGPNTVLLREGEPPIEGRAAAFAHLNGKADEWSWTPRLQGASAASDFAYAVGNYTVKTQGGETRKGQYVRVWVRDVGESAEQWVIAGEVMTPEPPQKK